MRGLRPYCLGFGLFWSLPLLITFGVMGFSCTPTDWLLFVRVKEIALAVFLPLCIFAAPLLTGRLRTWLPFAGGMLLCIVGYLYVSCFVGGACTPALSVVAGLLHGFTSAVFYLAWQYIYANEGQALAGIYLPFSAVLAFAVCLVLRFCPTVVTSICMVAVLPASAAFTLWRAACDMDPFPQRRVGQFLPAVLRDVWKPVLCAVVVCFVRAVAGHLPALYDSGIVMSMVVGLGGAALAAVAVGLWSSNNLDARGVFQIIVPLICIVLFVPALFGEKWLTLLMGTLMFGANLMLLLTLILCARYAASTQFSPASVYLVCAYPVHLATMLGNMLGFLITGPQAAQVTQGLEVPAACFIVCFVVLVVVSLGKHPRSLAEPADDTLLINPVVVEAPAPVEAEPPVEEELSDSTDNLLRIAEQAGLSTREVEVTELLLKGNTLSAIARKLFISENTTRGHMKRIYRKLDVHSRQELIDLIEDSKGE